MAGVCVKRRERARGTGEREFKTGLERNAEVMWVKKTVQI